MPTTYFSSEPEPESQTPQRPSRREPLVIKEHETIVLSATIAAPSVAAVTWLKDGVEIRRSKRHETTSVGDTHTLTVRGAQVLDSAIYSCRVSKEGQDFPVQVEGKQRLGGQASGSPYPASPPHISKSAPKISRQCSTAGPEWGSGHRAICINHSLTPSSPLRGGHQVLQTPGACGRGIGWHCDAGL